MPFSKEWDSKVKVFVFPYKINTGVMCHNCQSSFAKEHINVCTGLCVNCRHQNPIAIGRKSVTCETCEVVRSQKTNFGISRQVCVTCQVENHPLNQRCIACNTYSTLCWNHICSTCRAGKYLCEETGYFYTNMKDHFHKCWCLSYLRQKLRQDVQQMLRERK